MERGYSAQTVKHIRNVIGAVISFALQEGILAGKNCAWQVELPAMTRGRTQSLSAGEVRSILAMMKSPERETALIMIATGMNISEICGLLWSHVNLSDAAVRCESTDIPPRTLLVERQWNGHGLIAVQPNRVRLVDIPDGLFPLLFKWQCELTEPLHDACGTVNIR